MATLVISTQILENYGAHNWDGEGECPQRWKAKGSKNHKVINIDINHVDSTLGAIIHRVTEDNDYFHEYVIDWTVETDDWLSDFERNQLEYDGEIRFPEPTLEWQDVVESLAE